MPTSPTAPANVPAKPLLSEQAYFALKEQILEESLVPGSFVSERKLAESLKLSLAPIRRALQRLADEGFLRISPRQGAIVVDMSVEEVLDVYEIRKVLEAFVVRKITGRLSKSQTADLQRNLAAQRAAKREEDLRKTVQLDMDFHCLLCEYSGNREVQRVMQQLRDKVYRIIVRSVRTQPERTWASIDEHDVIADAVVSGDADRAAHWMERHMECGKRFVLLR